jgi:iron complex outermembrane receptor protein
MIGAQGIVDPTVDADSSVDDVSTQVADPKRSYVKTVTHALTLGWDINDQWAAKSVSAYRYAGYAPQQDLDGSVTPGLETSQSVLNAARSQEFQFNYTGDGVDGVAGFYYFKERQVNPMLSTFFPAVAGLYFERNSETTSRNTSKALYTSWDFDIADDWHLTLGGRYNWDHSDAAFSQTELFPSFGNLLIDYGSESFSKGWRKFTKTARLAYDVSPDAMAYIGYSEGYKQGGFNTQGGVLSVELGKTTYDPENVKTYTAGFKTTLLDNTLRFNAEWFYNDYQDKLVRVIASNPVDPTQLLQVNENAGSVYTTGVDVDVSWSTPLQGLVVNGSVGYLQSVIEEYNASQWNATGTGIINPDAASDFRMGYAPRWTVNLGPMYTLDLDQGSVLFAASAAYRSSAYASSPTDITAGYADSVAISDYATYNATIAFTTRDESWRFALEGRNLSDKRVLSDAFDLGSNLFAVGAYTDPRTWSLSARYQYQ